MLKEDKSNMNKNVTNTIFVPTFFSPTINNNNKESKEKSQLNELHNKKMTNEKFINDQINTEIKNYDNFEYFDNNICNYENYGTENELEKNFDNNFQLNQTNFNVSKNDCFLNYDTEKIKKNNKTNIINNKFNSMDQNKIESSNLNNQDTNLIPKINKINFYADTLNQQNAVYDNNQKNNKKENPINITKILDNFNLTTIEPTTNKIENIQKPFLQSAKNFGSNSHSLILRNKLFKNDTSKLENENENQTLLLNNKNLKINSNILNNNSENFNITTQDLKKTTKKFDKTEKIQNATIQTISNNNFLQEKTTKTIFENLTITPITIEAINFVEPSKITKILSTQLTQNKLVNFISTTKTISVETTTTTIKFNKNESINLNENNSMIPLINKTSIQFDPILSNINLNITLNNKSNEINRTLSNDLKLNQKNQTKNDTLPNLNTSFSRLKFNSFKKKKLTNQNESTEYRTEIKLLNHPEKRDLKLIENAESLYHQINNINNNKKILTTTMSTNLKNIMEKLSIIYLFK